MPVLPGKLWTTREVAALLGLSPATVLRRAGELPSFRLASNVLRFSADEVAAWLEARRCTVPTVSDGYFAIDGRMYPVSEQEVRELARRVRNLDADVAEYVESATRLPKANGCGMPPRRRSARCGSRSRTPAMTRCPSASGL